MKLKRTMTVIAAFILLLGFCLIGASIYAGGILRANSITSAKWEEALENRSSMKDKAWKIASGFQSTLKKWDETDTEWRKRADGIYAAASETLEKGSFEPWENAYAEWKDALEALNVSEDTSLSTLKKSVKGVNRQLKNMADAIGSWKETEQLILNTGVDPSKGAAVFLIRHRQLLLWLGIVLAIAGIFTFPSVRERIASSHQLVGYLFIAPALIFLLLFVAYPIVYNILLSFKDVDISNINYAEMQHFIGFDNYKTLFVNGDGQMMGAIGNTLVFTVASIFFQFIIGFLLALLFRNKFPGCRFIRGAIMISWLIPVTVSGLLFKFMFGMNGGIINQLLGTFGIQPIEWLYSLDYAMPSVILANIWIGIPFNMVLLLTGLTTIPKDVYESCDIDGATGFRRLFSITVPMIRPAIMSVLTLGFVYTFKVFDLVKVMTSGGPVNQTQLVSIYAYKLAFEKYEYSMGAAAGTVMFLILLIEGMFYIRAIREDEVM